MKAPFSANEFHRRLYRAFGEDVVDDLFEFYNDVNLAWKSIGALEARTTGQPRRDALIKSAAAAEGLLNAEYAMVLSRDGDVVSGALVFLNLGPQPGQHDTVKVSSARGGQEVERDLFKGQPGVATSPERYAFLLDKVRSRAILGDATHLFGRFRGDILELQSHLRRTIEVQRRLTAGLAPLLSLED